MQEIFNPDKHDLIRETIMVLFGLIARWLELKRHKRKQDNEF